MKNKNVIINLGKRSIFSRVLATFFYSLTLFLLYKYFILDNSFSLTKPNYQLRSKVYAITVLIVLGIKFSVIENHHFNFQEMKYRKFYAVGPIGFGKWKPLKALDRVSTFLNDREKCEVNIWDVRNNRYQIAVFGDIDNAVDYGRDLAKNLEIKFLERN